MAALIPNIAKGRFARYADLPEASDGLVWILLALAGLVSDAVLRDYDTVADILAGASAEATFTGYARVAATSVVVTVDDTNDRVDVDAADPQWNPTSSEALGKIVLAYDGDTAAGTDANLTPLFADDFAVTTATSGTLDYEVNAAGWGRAS